MDENEPLFSEEEQRQIQKEGGSTTRRHQDYTPEELEQLKKLMDSLTIGDARGFFLAIRRRNDEKSTTAEGMARVHGISRTELLDTFLSSFDFKPNDLTKYILMKQLEGASDE